MRDAASKAPKGMLANAVAAAALLVGLSAAPAAQAADSFIQTYLSPGAQALDQSVVCAGTSICVMGLETFNDIAPKNYAGTAGFTSALGTGGMITATFSGNFQIVGKDVYGGAANVGRYVTTFDHGAGYSVNLAHDKSLPGVNYFGMWLSALDGGNYLDFYRGNQLVYTYTPADLIDALGSCPNGYCGNPNTGANTNEQYAFINFYDQSGTFDRIVFHEDRSYGGGYEADNFSFGYRNPNLPFGTVVEVEGASPAPLPALAGTPFGLAAAALFMRRRRKGPAAA